MINSGVNISKAVGYAVLEIPAGVDMTKAVAYAVLTSVDAPNWSAAGFPAGWTGLAYNSFVPLTAGTQPVTFTLQSGTLPTGLTLSSSGGVATLSGTPTAAGTFAFVLRASNAYGAVDQSFMILISAATGGAGGGSYSFIA